MEIRKWFNHHLYIYMALYFKFRYVSCALGCPYEGNITPQKVTEVRYTCGFLVVGKMMFVCLFVWRGLFSLLFIEFSHMGAQRWKNKNACLVFMWVELSDHSSFHQNVREDCTHTLKFHFGWSGSIPVFWAFVSEYIHCFFRTLHSFLWDPTLTPETQVPSIRKQFFSNIY